MTILSLPALARAAEHHVEQHGPTSVDDLLAVLTRRAACPDRAEAGIRLAVIGGRLELDRDATLRTPTSTEQAA
jgi:hypothetical protein